MKILVLTDIHGSPDKIFNYLDNNSVDSIIITGDITDFGPEDYFVEILNKFSNYANVYALQGNCDPANSPDLLDKSNITNIHDNVSNIDEMIILGFGGSNPTPFDTPNEFSEEILYEKLSKFNNQLSSDSFTILVTHAPPYDTNADKIESGVHVGSKSIRKIIEETQPTLNLCGHVHESIGQDIIGKTTIINPGDAGNGHACLIELSKEDIKNKTFNLNIFTIE
ncbi:metallophosphoesterase family protein [Methanosphaera stadtmanae]|uniref:Metallophosphoesterase n=1 Tax=Methanosphaera stadtmanae TaxID=2317 RepID=A0A328Q810_9EURY|nr:metallophosphoesterase [Methanosphaera stadtmanae]MEE0489038.1 metallophosphoesterase [Methanosphaera stadtmanae]RAP02939.1 metallophosphoesterase [Methanosphaera stadtmanae]